MMAILFSLFFLALMFMWTRKESAALTWITVGLLFAAFLFWFHSTDVLNIQL
jgi:hypothetical protein